MMSWLRRTPTSRVDDVLNILLSMIMLFHPDGAVHLEDRGQVEKVQNVFIQAAHRYISTTYPGESALRFQEGMRLVQTVKWFNDIHERRLESCEPI